MKGINVCCDGEKSFKKELQILADKNKRKAKNNKLLLGLRMFFIEQGKELKEVK